MKSCGFCRNYGMLIVRLIIAAVFLYHGIGKLMMADQMMAFVGSVPHTFGLTFLPVSAWFWLAVAGELFIGITMLLGVWVRASVVVLWIIMFFAMAAKKFAWPAIEMDVILALMGLAVFVGGPGSKALDGSGCACACEK
jgi:uncharacterized membrane protein YphA (DoxX/SURF4 family)